MVSPADARLLTFDEDKARDAAHATLSALNVVSVDDVETLQLGEDLAKYLQAVLIHRGVLDTNGILQEERLPVRAEDLVLEPDGSERFGQIFDFLHGLYTAAVSEPTTVARRNSPGGERAGDSVSGAGDVDVQEGAADAEARRDRSAPYGRGGRWCRRRLFVDRNR